MFSLDNMGISCAASCVTAHRYFPDMRASCWTVGARPHDFSVAVWLDLDATKHKIVAGVPLWLQLGAELTDIWQAWLQALALLLVWTYVCCCGIATHIMGCIATHNRSCSSSVAFEADTTLIQLKNKPHLSVADCVSFD